MCVAVGVFLQLMYPRQSFSKVPIYIWVYELALVFGAWPVVSRIVHAMLFLAAWLDPQGDLAVYVEAIPTPCTAAAYFTVLTIYWTVFLSGHDAGTPYLDLVAQILVNLCWTSGFYTVLQCCTVYMGAVYRKNAFAADITRALFRERLLSKLSTPRRALSTQKKSVLAAGAAGGSLSRSSSDNGVSGLCDLEEDMSLPGLDSLVDDSYSESVSKSRFRYLEWFVRTRRLRTVKHSADFDYSWNEVSSRQEAGEVAARIFRNLSKGSRDIGFVSAEDLARHLRKPLAHPVVRKAFEEFRADSRGFITQDLITDEVISIYKQRKWLANNLADVENLTTILGRLLQIPFWIVVAVAWLVSFGYQLTTVILPLSSLLIGLSFAFGSTAKQVVESAVFVLSVRSCSIGDRIKINHSAETYTIKKISLFATQAVSSKGEEISIPNAILYGSIVSNMRRNPFASVTTSLHIDVRTPLAKITMLKEAVVDYCRRNANIWEEPTFEASQIDDSSKLVLQIYLRAKCSWQATDLWSPSKTEFIEHLAFLLNKLDIRYYPPTMRVELQQVPQDDDKCSHAADDMGLRASADAPAWTPDPPPPPPPPMAPHAATACRSPR